MDCGTKKRQPSGLHQKPNRNPAQHPQGVGRIRKAAGPPTAAHRLRFREEGQGNGADGIFAKKCRSKADFAPTWRRRGDSNPRTVLPAYSLSRGAPYSHLGTSAWLQVENLFDFGRNKWRREWDSNPRLLRVTGFQDQLLKPLGHLSRSSSNQRRLLSYHPKTDLSRAKGQKYRPI